MYKHMGKVVIKILQGSVVINHVRWANYTSSDCKFRTVHNVPKIMKIGWQWTKLLQKLSGLLFWPTL